jgi:hypothetical protein
MRGNLFALGTVPAQEACARFIALLRRRLGPERDGARLGIRRSDQDFDLSTLSLYLKFMNLFLILLRVQGGRRT